MSGCCLVQDVYFVEFVLFAVFNGEGQALDRVVDIDKGSSLLACSIETDWVPEGYLRTESVEHCSVVRVDVDSVNEVLMHVGFGSGDAPDDSLMELSDLEAKELLEVEESHIVKTLGHMINTSRIVRVYYLDWLALAFISVSAVEFCHAVTLRNVRAIYCSIAVDAHSADVDHMAFIVESHHCEQNIFRGKTVVGVGHVNGLEILHRVGC